MNFIRCVVVNKEIQSEIVIPKQLKCSCDRLIKEDEKIVKLACGHFLHVGCLDQHDALSPTLSFGSCPVLLGQPGNACLKKYRKFKATAIALKNFKEQVKNEVIASSPLALVALIIGKIMVSLIDNERLGIRNPDDQNLSKFSGPDSYMFSDKESFYLALIALPFLVNSLKLAFAGCRALLAVKGVNYPKKLDLSQSYQFKQIASNTDKESVLNHFFSNLGKN